MATLSVAAAYMLPLQAIAQQAAGQNVTQAGNGTLTTVMWVVLATWFGLALYLFSIDRAVRRLERRDDER